MIQPFWRYISKSYSLCPSLLIPGFNPLILLLTLENWNFLVSSASGRPEDVEEALAQYQETAGEKEAAASILSVSHNQHLKCTKIQILTLIFNAPRYQEMKSTS